MSSPSTTPEPDRPSIQMGDMGDLTVSPDAYKDLYSFIETWIRIDKKDAPHIRQAKLVARNEFVSLIKARDERLKLEASQEAIILKADLAAAMGHMRGCGHEHPYLTKRYPMFNEAEKEDKQLPLPNKTEVIRKGP